MFFHIKDIAGKEHKVPTDLKYVFMIFTASGNIFIYALYTNRDKSGAAIFQISLETYAQLIDEFGSGAIRQIFITREADIIPALSGKDVASSDEQFFDSLADSIEAAGDFDITIGNLLDLNDKDISLFTKPSKIEEKLGND